MPRPTNDGSHRALLRVRRRPEMAASRPTRSAAAPKSYADITPCPQRTNKGGAGGPGKRRESRRQHLIDNHHTIPKHDGRRSPPSVPEQRSPGNAKAKAPVKMHLPVRLKMAGYMIRPPPGYARDRQLIATFSVPRANVEHFADADGTPRVAASGRTGDCPLERGERSAFVDLVKHHPAFGVPRVEGDESMQDRVDAAKQDSQSKKSGGAPLSVVPATAEAVLQQAQAQADKRRQRKEAERAVAAAAEAEGEWKKDWTAELHDFQTIISPDAVPWVVRHMRLRRLVLTNMPLEDSDRLLTAKAGPARSALGRNSRPKQTHG